jgi:3-hydroxyacyl-CoA dehydrogenase
MEIHAIAIVGTGFVGASRAAFFAARGLSVRLYDKDAEGCTAAVSKALAAVAAMGEGGLISSRSVERSGALVSAHTDLEDAVKGVQLVQESVAEDYAAKQSVFERLDRLTPPEVLLASSSSGLLMTEIQKKVRYPGRCLIAHPFNPPHLIPLVELVPGSHTDPAVIQQMRQFLKSLGKEPVVLNKEVPGHLANRLAAALWREAIDLVLQGVATVEDVDKAVCAGPGLRWALMGQHTIYHLGGGAGGIDHFLDHLTPAFESWLQSMSDWKQLPENTRAVLKRGLDDALGDRSIQDIAEWRDEKLMDLLKALYETRGN